MPYQRLTGVDSGVSPAISGAREGLRKAQTRDALSKKIEERPPPEFLQKKNILKSPRGEQASPPPAKSGSQTPEFLRRQKSLKSSPAAAPPKEAPKETTPDFKAHLKTTPRNSPAPKKAAEEETPEFLKKSLKATENKPEWLYCITSHPH